MGGRFADFRMRANLRVKRCFVFENPGDAWGFEFHPLSYEHGQAIGSELQGDTAEQLWTLPPGQVAVACLPDARSSYFDPDAVTATLTVVDPDGLYVPWNLVCGSASSTGSRSPPPRTTTQRRCSGDLDRGRPLPLHQLAVCRRSRIWSETKKERHRPLGSSPARCGEEHPIHPAQRRSLHSAEHGELVAEQRVLDLERPNAAPTREPSDQEHVRMERMKVARARIGVHAPLERRLPPGGSDPERTEALGLAPASRPHPGRKRARNDAKRRAAASRRNRRWTGLFGEVGGLTSTPRRGLLTLVSDPPIDRGALIDTLSPAIAPGDDHEL